MPDPFFCGFLRVFIVLDLVFMFFSLSFIVFLMVFIGFDLALGQNLRYLFGVGYPSKVVYFKRLFGCSPGYRGFDPQPFGFHSFSLSFIVVC